MSPPGVSTGDGWAVTEFGVNVITIPPGYATGGHYHERRQELYFVHHGAIEMTFGDGAKAELREGGAGSR
jgi:mannose-6-phosphate isomerase-like protein (cupin superfamily)